MRKTPHPSADSSRPMRSIALNKLLPILFWIGVWELLSLGIAQELLLVSPLTAVKTLVRMMKERSFYGSVARTFGKILLGFVLGSAIAVALACLGKAVASVRRLLAPLMTSVKAMPVASFVILALVWVKANNLSVLVALLMVIPIMYENVLTGLENADGKLLEMARVFDIPLRKRASAIYAPSAYPYFLAACRSALGMCWKAGIAAEVIAQPNGSIGDSLYRAKLFWATDELFAWTLAIILISVLFEKGFLLLLKRASVAFGGGNAHD